MVDLVVSDIDISLLSIIAATLPGLSTQRSSNFTLVGSHKITLNSLGQSKFPLDKVLILLNWGHIREKKERECLCVVVTFLGTCITYNNKYCIHFYTVNCGSSLRALTWTSIVERCIEVLSCVCTVVGVVVM